MERYEEESCMVSAWLEQVNGEVNEGQLLFLFTLHIILCLSTWKLPKQFRSILIYAVHVHFLSQDIYRESSQQKQCMLSKCVCFYVMESKLFLFWNSYYYLE